MKIICKQCHKEFELTDSDIKFFTSRNLNIPKRCKRCREINRKNNALNNYNSDEVKIADYKTIILILSVVIVAILIISGMIIFSLSQSGNSEYSQSSVLSIATQTTHTVSSTQTKPITTKTTKITQTTQTKPTTSSTKIKQTTSTTQAKQVTYYLNTYRNKFHEITCDSVQEMNPKNKKAFYGTRDEAIAQGYSPCHNCNP